MARIQRLYTATDDDTGWATYLDELVAQQRRKSSFMAKVRNRGWL